MRSIHRWIALSISFLSITCLGYPETAREAALREAKLLALSWDSPAPKGDSWGNVYGVTAIVGLPDGSILAALAPQGEAYTYYEEQLAQLVRLEGEDGTRTELTTGEGFAVLAVDGAGDYVAAGDDYSIVLFRPDDPEDVQEEWRGIEHNSSLVFLPGERTIATGGRDARVHILGGNRGADLALVGHAATITALASSGGILYSASADGSVKAWETATGALRATFRPGLSRIVGIAADGQARTLSVILADGTGVVYDLSSRAPASTWRSGLAVVSRCAISRDGALAALYDGQGSIVIWDLARSGEAERVAAGVDDERSLTALAFTADHGRLLVGYSDGTVSARTLQCSIDGLLARGGLTEAERLAWQAERLLDSGDAAGAARLYQKAGDAKGIAKAGRALLEDGAVDAAEKLFRDSADRDGLALAGRLYLEHGAWEAAERCLAETQGAAAAAAAVGDACFDAQEFQEALGFYAQAGDAARLKKLAQALFVRRDYAAAADAYARSGDKAGLRRAAEALYTAGERTAAARLLVAAGEKATVSAWASSLLAAGELQDAGELCAMVQDAAGARKAAGALLQAKEYEAAFGVYLAVGDRVAAKRIPDSLVTEGGMLFRRLESFLELQGISDDISGLFGRAARMYEQGGMEAEVTASLPAYVKNYDYIFPMIWYSATGQRERIKEVADAAFPYGILIASLVGYAAVDDTGGITKVAQALMNAKRYEEAAAAYGMLDDEAGSNAAAAALLAAGKAEEAEEIYRETEDEAGLSALAASARRAGQTGRAAELYALAGDAASVYAIAAEVEKKSGPAAAVELYVLIPDAVILTREAARLTEAGFYAEARELLEEAEDSAGLADLAERYADSGLLDEASEIYTSLGDYEAAERIDRRRSAATPGSGRQGGPETAEAKKRRAAAALAREDYQEAGEAYGELGDYAGLMRAVKGSLEGDWYSTDYDAASELARRFSYKPAFAAIAAVAEERGDYATAGECYRETGDREALRAFALRIIEGDTSQGATAILAFTYLEDREGLAELARTLLVSEEPYDSTFEESYEPIVAGLGDGAASGLADEMLAEGSYRFPVTWFVGKGDRAGIGRCALAALESGSNEELAASLYAHIDDPEGLATVAAAILDSDAAWRVDESLALAIYRKAGDKAGLSRCAASALEEARGSTDYREAGLLYLEAKNTAGMLAVAAAFAEAKRPALAAHWALLAGDPKKASSYRQASLSGVRFRLEASQSSDMSWDEETWPIWWQELLSPIEVAPGESELAAGIRGQLEEAEYVVVGEAEGPYDYALRLRRSVVESASEADGIELELADSRGTVLLSVTEEGLETDGHALLEELPEIVRQRLAE